MVSGKLEMLLHKGRAYSPMKSLSKLIGIVGITVEVIGFWILLAYGLDSESPNANYYVDISFLILMIAMCILLYAFYLSRKKR